MGLFLITPALLLLLAVTVFPVGQAFYMSLHETRFTEIGSFVGADNYIGLFRSESFRNSLFLSIVYVAGSLLIAMSLGLALAMLLKKRTKWSGAFRTIITLPWVLSQVVVSMVWLWSLDPAFGLVNYFVQLLGQDPVAFLADLDLAMPTVIAVNAWRAYPLALILFLAALQSVPEDLQDAAMVDGATAPQRFFRVTLPLIFPTIMVVAILLTIEFFNMVALIYTMTGGGPVSATNVLAVSAFKEGFVHWRLDIASTMAVVIAALNGIFALTYVRLLRSRT